MEPVEHSMIVLMNAIVQCELCVLFLGYWQVFICQVQACALFVRTSSSGQFFQQAALCCERTGMESTLTQEATLWSRTQYLHTGNASKWTPPPIRFKVII